MITVNITKAKEIAHDMRRAARTAEFATLDVLATIPPKADEAEKSRQYVRDKYSVMQESIDAAETESELIKALNFTSIII